MSIRTTVRVTGVAKATVMKLLVTAGKVCADYQDRVLSELPCRRVQADEIWSFIYAKEKNVPRAQIADLVRLIDEATPPPGPRGPYRKRENSNQPTTEGALRARVSSILRSVGRLFRSPSETPIVLYAHGLIHRMPLVLLQFAPLVPRPSARS